MNSRKQPEKVRPLIEECCETIHKLEKLLFALTGLSLLLLTSGAIIWEKGAGLWEKIIKVVAR